MKRYLIGFIVGACCFTSLQVFAADKFSFTTIKMMSINNKSVDITAQAKRPLVLEGGSVYFSEFTLNELGYNVTRAKDNSSISITTRDLISNFYIDGKPLSFDPFIRPRIIQGNTYFPSSFLENLGYRKPVAKDRVVTKENISFYLRSEGTNYYPDLNHSINVPSPQNHIKVTDINENVVKEPQATIMDSSGKATGNYVHVLQSKANIHYAFNLFNNYRRFSTTFAYPKAAIIDVNDKVTIQIKLDSKIFKIIELTTVQSSISIEINVRDKNKIEFVYENQSANEVDVEMKDPVFVK
ncbi:hypothetical protein EHS13_17470 [Paenibacillus psychroresistens]|uniref:Copper amine oxidase-like N-terminal domain-containing protein n=1 Tax=Paenibacillus psychroresistens TaxID=1778678 RepID=A0A6B8RMG7_9BACL|nr:hypothetical protein [Paenibacillus psychroresistens]QGQ96548.1 hypothetical protein EHS13_17470 [Paenibacillus psychroresistens]